MAEAHSPWTLAHVTNTIDAWINVRFQGRAPHALISQERFRIGGTGLAEDWSVIQHGVAEVREAARAYLLGLDDGAELVIPYEGSILHLKETGLSLRYALIRIATHHYVHMGEIATLRSRLGYHVDLPGPLEECLAGRYR
ncbi:MAG: hypothetical protein GEU73_11415 [Chloroflexi bacterium]|nr:hypothetical protein [Chloroflexota bacterium]